MFELKNVTKFYNNNGVVTLGLHNINLKLSKGEIVAITGDSGSGKSTLLNVITGVDTYEEGEILFYGNETSYFNQNDMDLFRQNNVSFIFQKYNIIESYTVLQNVMLPLELSGKKEKEAKQEAIELIKKVGLEKRIKNKGTELSGGEKQRCVIARALATNSLILACDEPTGNLDSKTGDEIINLIKEVSKDKLVLIVTHNFEQVKDIVTRKITLKDGEIIEDKKMGEEIDEENHEMVLSNNKVSKKTLFKLSHQNILSTPKKTILSSSIFFVISLITLILSLLIINVSYSVEGDNSRDYNLLSEDRLIVYDKDHQGLDIDKINNLGYTTYTNPFYEESYVNLISVEKMTKKFSITKYDIPYKMVKGTDKSKDGDYVIVLPKGSDIYWYTQFYDNDLKVVYDDIYGLSERVGYCTGIATSSEVKAPYIIPFNKNDNVLENVSINNTLDIFYTYDNTKYLVEKVKRMEHKPGADTLLDTSRLVIPTNLKNKVSINYLLGGLYEASFPNLEIVYSDLEGYIYPTFEIGKDFLIGKLTPVLDKVYEVSLYAKNIKKAKNELEGLGYSITIPTHVKTNEKRTDLFTLYTFMGLLLIALFGLFFVSFAIISRIYQSKTKDYGVLRALGMVKKDLGHMVKIETISLGLISSLISLILFVVVGLCIPNFKLIKDLSLLLIVFYFVVMLVFAYFTARKFNTKLFKFSVSTKLKDGELSD